MTMCGRWKHPWHPDRSKPCGWRLTVRIWYTSTNWIPNRTAAVHYLLEWSAPPFCLRRPRGPSFSIKTKCKNFKPYSSLNIGKYNKKIKVHGYTSITMNIIIHIISKNPTQKALKIGDFAKSLFLIAMCRVRSPALPKVYLEQNILFLPCVFIESQV